MNKLVKIAGSLAIVGVLFSCISTKKYERPKVASSDAFRSDSMTTDTNSIAHYNWKQFFNDPTLTALIDEGLKNNFDLRIAIKNIDIAQSYLKQARVELGPSFNIQAKAGVNDPSLNSLQGQAFSQHTTLNDFTLQGNFSWELDIWGKLRYQRKAALASYNQTLMSQLAVKSHLIASIANQYYLLLSLDKQREYIKTSVKNREESLTMMAALKKSGNITEVAVKQNEALLYTAQGMLADIELQIHLTENALSLFLGKSPSTFNRSSIDSVTISTPLNIGVPIQLLSNRPDVMIAEQELRKNFETMHAAKANFYPSLQISASGGLNSMNFDQLFSANSLFASILGSLTQPIFNKRAIKTQYEVAKSKQEIALMSYEQSVLNAYKEVSDVLYSMQANDKKLIIKKQEESTLSIALNFSEQLQKQGMINYLEVIRAKESTLSAQIALTQLQYAKLKSTVDLYRALGGGWK